MTEINETKSTGTQTNLPKTEIAFSRLNPPTASTENFFEKLKKNEILLLEQMKSLIAIDEELNEETNDQSSDYSDSLSPVSHDHWKLN